MLTYIIRRLLHMIPILFGVACLVFLLFTAVGEDPVRVTLGEHATPEAVELLRAKWGLDQSLPKQFLDFLGQIVTFDYGRSYNTDDRIVDMFNQGALVSLSITGPPFVIGTILNLIIAVTIAYYRGSKFDRYSTVVFVAAMSVSYLVYIIGFQYLLAFKADLFEINGYAHGLESIPFLLLPWLITIVVTAGPDIRMFRTVFLDETKSDYVRTAHAKGTSEPKILLVHIMKNAMIPILTYTVNAIPFLLLGSFVMERFFSIPGLGDMMITALNNGDFPVIKAMTMMIALAFSVFNLLTDILYAWVDPRIKLS
ncbi:MAG: peptide ABC transporter permease [Zetaproteobacteria bacterium]|nr:peptide ABC transporter permease [Pseudobdellovibrionaceae bacterium]